MVTEYINTSLPHLNDSVRVKTAYQSCSHMPEIIILYLAFQFINMFMGIPANLMVLWLIHQNRSNSSTSDIFIVQLAIIDTLFCLIPPLELINTVYIPPKSIGYVLRFFYGVKDSSPLFLASICLDRYMAVLHPINFSNLKDGRHRTVSTGVMWLITLAYGIAQCVGTIPNFEKVFTVMILTTFTFMVFCNISILWALWNSGPGRDEMHPVKKRAFKMVLIILAIITFNYFPPIALLPFKSYFSLDVFNCYISYLAYGLMNISSSIQPVLYLSKLNPKCPACFSRCCTTKQTESGNRTMESSIAYTTNG